MGWSAPEGTRASCSEVASPIAPSNRVCVSSSSARSAFHTISSGRSGETGHHGSRMARGNGSISMSSVRAVSKWRPCARCRTSSQIEFLFAAGLRNAALAPTPSSASNTDGPCHAGPRYDSASVVRMTSRAGSVAASRNGLPGEVLGRHIVALRQVLHVGDEPPDLIVSDAAAPRRHAIGATLVNRLIDLACFAAEMPAAVLKARPHRAGSISAVAIQAVIRDEQLGTLGDTLRVSFEGIDEWHEPSLQRESGLDVVRVLEKVCRLRALLHRRRLPLLRRGLLRRIRADSAERRGDDHALNEGWDMHE